MTTLTFVRSFCMFQSFEATNPGFAVQLLTLITSDHEGPPGNQLYVIHYTQCQKGIWGATNVGFGSWEGTLL